ncbi:unnamed protein product [Closterium sp. Yama58-4]|nr:unnamed protein product [Closterium sp. Yama58-4]
MEEVTPGCRRHRILMVPHFELDNVKHLSTPVGRMFWIQVLMEILSEAYLREAVERMVEPNYYVDTIKPRHRFTNDTFLVDQFANTLTSLSLRDAEHILGKVFQKFASGMVGKAELVFHGTPSKNKASGFSGTGTVIVFLVIVTSDALVHHYSNAYVILNNSKYQLPLGTISVNRYQ